MFVYVIAIRKNQVISSKREGCKGRGGEGEGKGREGACAVLIFPFKNPCIIRQVIAGN